MHEGMTTSDLVKFIIMLIFAKSKFGYFLLLCEKYCKYFLCLSLVSVNVTLYSLKKERKKLINLGHESSFRDIPGQNVQFNY